MLELLHQALHACFHLGPFTRDAGDTDQISEPPAAATNPGHPLLRCGGRDKQHQVQSIRFRQRGQALSLLQGQIRNNQACCTGFSRLPAEPFHPHVEQWIRIREQDHRNGEAPLQGLQHLQHRPRRRAGVQRTGGCSLNHRTVRQGIAVGHPQFHHVRSRSLQCQEHLSGGLQIRVTGHQERHQRQPVGLTNLLETLSDGGHRRTRHRLRTTGWKTRRAYEPAVVSLSSTPILRSRACCSSGDSASKRASRS